MSSPNPARAPRPAVAQPPPAARDRILAAALQEFADRGYEGATTAEIARRAGVTQPLVHYHFASKEALWKAAVDDLFDRLVHSFGGALQELTDVGTEQRLKVLLRRFVRFTAENPELPRVMARETSRGGPRLEWLAERHVRRLHDHFRTAFETGRAEGVIKPLLGEFVMFILMGASAHLFVATGMARQLHGMDVTDPQTIETHTSTLIEVLFHGLLTSNL